MVNRLKNPGLTNIITSDPVSDHDEAIRNRADNLYHCRLISTDTDNVDECIY